MTIVMDGRDLPEDESFKAEDDIAQPKNAAASLLLLEQKQVTIEAGAAGARGHKRSHSSLS